MPAYLLDTNHLIALLNRIPAAVEKQRQLEETGSRVCSTTISLGELYFGAFHSQHRPRNLRRLSRIRRRFVFLPFDERAAIEYGRIREETHSRGTPIPVAGTMIAAIARPLRLRVLSHDEHFRWVPGLQVEDWLA
jgi:tRNA(fMet)-specific endonuclease VapC